jgi:GNAT superfamily N-acetyltransferase
VNADARAIEIDVRRATGEEGCVGAHRVRAGAFAAFIDGDLVGLAEYHVHFYGHAFIELLLVDERHRRRGVATALVTACAHSAPTNRLFTSTNLSNVAAQNLFLQAGFQASGSIENLDDNDPELVYCKRLDPTRAASDQILR